MNRNDRYIMNDRVIMLYLLIRFANESKYTIDMMEKDASIEEGWIKEFLARPFSNSNHYQSWRLSELEYKIKINAPSSLEKREELLSNPDLIKEYALSHKYGFDVKTLKIMLWKGILTNPALISIKHVISNVAHSDKKQVPSSN